MQTKRKALRRSLWASALAILLCIAMLLGTTFAWFTDTVSSTGNTIQAGTLSIQLNGADTAATLFSSANDLWEPGYSQKAAFTVKNTGNLWLKYSLQVVNVQDNDGLAKVLDVYLQNSSATSLEGADFLGTVADLASGLGTASTKDQPLAPGASSDEKVLVIKMKESAGNEYQNKKVTFDINILATQYTAEEDGFGSDQYDADAKYPTVVSNAAELSEAVTKGGEVKLTGEVSFSGTGSTPVLKLATDDTNLDLNGKKVTVTSANGKDGLEVTGKNITIRGGAWEQDKTYGSSYPVVTAKGSGNTLTLSDMVITAEDGGYAVKASSNTTVILRNCTINGDLYVASQGKMEIQNCTINGKICVQNNGTATLDATSTYQGKKTPGDGTIVGGQIVDAGN